MCRIFQLLYVTSAMLVAGVAPLVVRAGAVEAMDNPFARPSPTAPVEPAEPGPLDHLELTGVSTLGGQTRVCLTAGRTKSTRWLAIGEAADGFAAVEFDPQRDAVLIQAGGASRWIAMRKATIVAMALPRMEHGAIDWVHVGMTERQKAREAEAMLTDILEVAQLGRSGGLEAPR